MASEHETFIQGLASLGHHMGHPDAKALIEKAKEVVETTEAKVLGEVAKLAPKRVENAVEKKETEELNEASLAKAKADAAAQHP